MAAQEPTGERLREMMREGFTLAVGAAAWAFEVGDRLVGTWMERGHISREEGLRKFEEFKARTRETVRNAAASMPVATRDQVAELERRVEELTREVEALRRSGPSS